MCSAMIRTLLRKSNASRVGLLPLASAAECPGGLPARRGLHQGGKFVPIVFCSKLKYHRCGIKGKCTLLTFYLPIAQSAEKLKQASAPLWILCSELGGLGPTRPHFDSLVIKHECNDLIITLVKL